jgi:hypothetical protein
MTAPEDLLNRIYVRSLSRRKLLKTSAALGAGAVAFSAVGGAMAGVGGSGRSVLSAATGVATQDGHASPFSDDIEILNYALTLEYLETAAYHAINEAGVLSGRAATYFESIEEAEAAHVAALIDVIRQLGGTPVNTPAFDFSSVPSEPEEIVAFFQSVEVVGAGAYHGAAPYIQSPEILAAALSIHAVEAEHASALADIVAPGTALFSPAAFATPLSPDEVLEIVAPFFAPTPGAPEGLSIYIAGLHNPRGLGLDPHGTLVVSEVGNGGDVLGRISRILPRHPAGDGMYSTYAKALVNGLPSVAGPEGGEVVGVAGFDFAEDGTLYFVTGLSPVQPASDRWQALWSTGVESSNPLQVAAPYASLGRAEAELNPDGGIVDSNPWDVVVDADGNAYVSDSGANVVWKVAPDGAVSVYAVIPPIPVNPPIPEAPPVMESVPTGIAWGPDGALYVGTLTGFPFQEGAAVVYRLEDADGDGDALEEGEVTVYASGLTTVTDIDFTADGHLIAAEFRGFLTTYDPNTGAPILNSGRVVMWDDEAGELHEVFGGLTAPTGIAAGKHGEIFVTQEWAGIVNIYQPPMEVEPPAEEAE